MNSVVFEQAVADLARSPGLGVELTRIAEQIVLPLAHESLGDANELHENQETGFPEWGLNPPPGPPMMRSEQLHDSVEVQRPELDFNGQLCVPLTTYAIAERPSGAWRYDLILRDGADGRGREPYRFLIDSPFFIYREYPATVSYQA